MPAVALRTAGKAKLSGGMPAVTMLVYVEMAWWKVEEDWAWKRRWLTHSEGERGSVATVVVVVVAEEEVGGEWCLLGVWIEDG